MSRLLAIACAGLLGAACSGEATGIRLLDGQAIRTELARNEAKWSAFALTDYRYAFRRVCDCAPEATAAVEIEVRGGSVYRVRLLSTGADVAPGSGYWPTVDELFDEIRLALDEGATDIRVRYDPVYGYPLEVSIQWTRDAAGTIVHYAGELIAIQSGEWVVRSGE
jgi:hypothetical protein